jgi:hypothetical protein
VATHDKNGDSADDKLAQQPQIACDIHSFGATAARAFEALTAIEPESSAPAVSPSATVAHQRARPLTPEMVKRIADRAEAASKRNG